MTRHRLVSLTLILFFNGVLHADEIRMPENAPRPLKIGVAVSVNNISKINDQSGTMEAGIDVQLRWKDTNLAFDPLKSGMNRMEFNRDSAAKKLSGIWTPALRLADATIQSSERGLFIYADGTVVFIQRMKVIFDVKYRLEAFPFDTQSIPVRIVSEWYGTNQIELTQDQRDIDKSGLSKEVKSSAWKPRGLKFVASSTQGWDGQYYPEMQAQIVLSRHPYAHLFFILLPFFLVMLVPTLGMFQTKMDIGPRLTFWGASILALIALSFTYSARYSALPPDSIITQVIVIGAGYQILMILLTVTLLNPKNTDRWFSNPFIVPEIISYLHWAIPLGLIGLVVTRVMLTALIV